MNAFHNRWIHILFPQKYHLILLCISIINKCHQNAERTRQSTRILRMHSNDDDKPPAPPLRLTSNRSEFLPSLPVDMRPLPKEPEEQKKHHKSKSKKSKENYSLL